VGIELTIPALERVKSSWPFMKPKCIIYSVCRSPPRLSLLCQWRSIHIFISYVIKNHFNIILHSVFCLFVIYLKAQSIIQTMWLWTSGWQQSTRMICIRWGRKRRWSNLSYYSEICMKRLRKTTIKVNRLVRFPAAVGIVFYHNTSEKFYCLS
jgi:hypothetical protein